MVGMSSLATVDDSPCGTRCKTNGSCVGGLARTITTRYRDAGMSIRIVALKAAVAPDLLDGLPKKPTKRTIVGTTVAPRTYMRRTFSGLKGSLSIVTNRRGGTGIRG